MCSTCSYSRVCIIIVIVVAFLFLFTNISHNRHVMSSFPYASDWSHSSVCLLGCWKLMTQRSLRVRWSLCFYSTQIIYCFTGCLPSWRLSISQPERKTDPPADVGSPIGFIDACILKLLCRGVWQNKCSYELSLVLLRLNNTKGDILTTVVVLFSNLQEKFKDYKKNVCTQSVT